MNGTKRVCVVSNCGSRSGKLGENLSFHRLPINEERRKIWVDRLNLQPHEIKPNAMVCNLHFKPQDIEKKKMKYFVNSNAVPLKWANDLRNIHRNDKKDDHVNRILDETEIKIESEQISYANDSEIFFMPKTEPTTARPSTFMEGSHINKKITQKKEIAPDTSEILEALKSKNEENMKLHKTNQQLRKEIKCLRLQLQRRNKKISTLKAKLKKDKPNKKAETIPSSPESTEFSNEEFVEVNELEELDESNDSLNLDLHQEIDST